MPVIRVMDGVSHVPVGTRVAVVGTVTEFGLAGEHRVTVEDQDALDWWVIEGCEVVAIEDLQRMTEMLDRISGVAYEWDQSPELQSYREATP